MYATDALRLRTVVIDPGHGGKDPGAVSRDGKTRESTLTLDISKRLASLIREGCPDVKVVLTRESDTFVPLASRAEAAGKAGADLFVSIHINAAKNTSASGYSAHVLGQSRNPDKDLYEMNMEAVMRENSVINFEDDKTSTYEGLDPSNPESYIFMQLMQNAYLEQSLVFAADVTSSLGSGPLTRNRGVWQNPFFVLWNTSMPSVLVELGFISNSADLLVLRSSSSRQKLAQCLYSAFKAYKAEYDKSVGAESETAPSASSVPAPSSPAASGPEYGIQIFAGTSDIPPTSSKFMGYTPRVVKSGKIRKYVICVSRDVDKVVEKLPSVKKKYPDAFVVIVGESSTVLYKK